MDGYSNDIENLTTGILIDATDTDRDTRCSNAIKETYLVRLVFTYTISLDTYEVVEISDTQWAAVIINLFDMILPTQVWASSTRTETT